MNEKINLNSEIKSKLGVLLEKEHDLIIYDLKNNQVQKRVEPLCVLLEEHMTEENILFEYTSEEDQYATQVVTVYQIHSYFLLQRVWHLKEGYFGECEQWSVIR